MTAEKKNFAEKKIVQKRQVAIVSRFGICNHVREYMYKHNIMWLNVHYNIRQFTVTHISPIEISKYDHHFFTLLYVENEQGNVNGEKICNPNGMS